MTAITTNRVCRIVCLFLVAILATVTSTTNGFIVRGCSSTTTKYDNNELVRFQPQQQEQSSSRTTGTALAGRRWNFNEGQSPWGLKVNAETWNGRVAQMAFVWVFLQELIAGKGIFKGIEEGDPFFLANAALFGVLVLGLTGWLAIQGDDDYTKQT